MDFGAMLCHELERQALPTASGDKDREQTPYHILQDCPLFEVQCQQTWPEDLDSQTELWVTETDLRAIRRIHRSKNLMLSSNTRRSLQTAVLTLAFTARNKRLQVIILAGSN
jgi:hypothetical protein